MSTIVAASLVHGGIGDAPDQVLHSVLPAIGINAVLCLTAAVLTALFLRRPARVAD